MNKRSIIVLILLSIMATAPWVFANKVFFITENRVKFFDWQTRKASRTMRVKGKILAVIEGHDPNFAFVLSKGRINDHLPTGPSYIACIDLRKGRIQKSIAIGFGLKDYYYDEKQDKLFLLTGAIGPFPNKGAELGLYVFDLQSQQVDRILPLTCNPVAKAISSDKNYLAIISAGINHKDHGKFPSLQIYNLARKELVAEQQLPPYPAEVLFSKDNSKLYILTAGYPNRLPTDYPQLGQRATQATISIWDFNSRQLSEPVEIGTGAREMSLLADNLGVSVLSNYERKPVTFSCSPTLVVRKLSCDKESLDLISQDQGQISYLVTKDSVEVIDNSTWTIIKSIPFIGKAEQLTLGVLPDGKSFLLERTLNRLRIYDPRLNRVEIVSFDRAKDIFGITKTKNVSFPRGEAWVLTKKMYLLATKEPYVLVFDLDSMQVIKKISTRIIDQRGDSVNIYPDVLVPSPDGSRLYACELLDCFGVVPIDTEFDEVAPGGNYSFDRLSTSVSNLKVGSIPTIETSKATAYVAGPVVDLENQVIYCACNGFLEYFDLKTWKSESERIDKWLSFMQVDNQLYPVRSAR